MKKFFIFCLLGCAIFPFQETSAKEPVRTENSIVVIDGVMLETGVIADSDGMVFLEFGKDTRVRNTQTQIPFDGEILPPQVIALPDKRPRERMQEILTIELLADTADEISFIDKFDVMGDKTRLRYELFYPEEFKRTASVKLLMPIHQEYSSLALWEYRGIEDGWIRMGGKVEESSEEGVFVFSSYLHGTGVFTLFEEDPSPDFVPTFPLDQIEMAEPDPFALLEENEVGINTDENLFLPSAPEQTTNTLPDEYIPAVEVEGEEISSPLLPTTEIPVEIEAPFQTPESSTLSPSSPTLDTPSSTELPSTGPEDTSETPTQKFPFGIVFAFFIIGISVYFAFFQKKYR